VCPVDNRVVFPCLDIRRFGGETAGERDFKPFRLLLTGAVCSPSIESLSLLSVSAKRHKSNTEFLKYQLHIHTWNWTIRTIR